MELVGSFPALTKNGRITIESNALLNHQLTMKNFILALEGKRFTEKRNLFLIFCIAEN